jgi:hypothetical protein
MIPLSQKGTLHMLRVPRLLHHLVQLTCTLLTLLVDAAHFLWLCLHAPTALAAWSWSQGARSCWPPGRCRSKPTVIGFQSIFGWCHIRC